MNKYVISIDDDRLKKFENMMPNMSFKAFKGIKKDIIKQQKHSITSCLCNLFCTNSMIGCASSHILLWKYILQKERKNTIFLICEDDTYIDENEFKTKEQTIINFMKQYPMCFFQLTGEGIYFIKNDNYEDIIYKEYKYHLFLGSYCVTYQYLDNLVDYFMSNRITYHIDLSITLYNDQNNHKQAIIIPQMAHQIKSIGGPFDELVYSLNFPIISIDGIIINILFIIVSMISFIFFYSASTLYYIFIGYILYYFVKFDL